jgi:hypothetical protein
MTWPKDILNRFARGHQTPEVYLIPHSLPVPLIGTAKQPLTLDRVTCSYVLIEASLNNQGIIYIGGPECDVNTGIELDGGRGILFTATPPLTPQQMMAGNIGSSMLSNVQALSMNEVETALQMIALPVPALNLADFFIVAGVADQSLRVLYFGLQR